MVPNVDETNVIGQVIFSGNIIYSFEQNVEAGPRYLPLILEQYTGSHTIVAGRNRALPWNCKESILGPTFAKMKCSGKIYWDRNRRLPSGSRISSPTIPRW